MEDNKEVYQECSMVRLKLIYQIFSIVGLKIFRMKIKIDNEC